MKDHETNRPTPLLSRLCRNEVENNMKRTITLVAGLILVAGVSAQRGFDEVQIEATDLGGGVHMLKGAGGNLAVSIGEDGAFLVDDQFAPLTDKIQAKVSELGGGPVKFVINTHWHGDHTGGNENFGKAGAIIVAHDNIHKRMSQENFNAWMNRTTPPSPPGALPVVTFTDRVTLHRNGDMIHAIHLPHGHTDGDAMVLFEKANVLHMGDLYFNGLYPFIDVDSGGSVDGFIAAVNKGLSLADEQTKIIPGHGPVATRAQMQTYRDMLVELRGNVAKLKADGNTLEQAIAANPTAKYDEALGGFFIKPDDLTRFIYLSLP